MVALDLEHHYISDLSFLAYMPNLRVLKNLTELEDLNLCYNPVTTTEPIRALPNLQRLWNYATDIPAKEIAALYTLYPDTQIVTSGSGSVDQGWRSGAHYDAMRSMVINNVIDEVYRED